MASGSLPSFTVLTGKDDVPGSKFDRGRIPRWQVEAVVKVQGIEKRDELQQEWLQAKK